MEIKEKFVKLKKKLAKKHSKESANKISMMNINLDAKVDKFIEWYYKNLVKGNYTDIGEFYQPNKMRNFIEKMAVWYELRYPDYEVNRLMPGSNQESIAINDVMFMNNLYIKQVLNIDSDVKKIDWAKFYNAQAFTKSLPWEEGYIFVKPKFNDLVYLEKRKNARLYLTSDGFVQKSVGVFEYTKFKVKDKELVDKHIKDVINLLKAKDVVLPQDNELEKNIEKVEKWEYCLEEMLNCVMYRIIERGGKRIGPRRAFLFAKEFHRNIEIPMMYGIDYFDPGLENFIKDYINSGGSDKLMCCVGYFSKKGENEKISMVSIQEIVKEFYDERIIKYTPEQRELYRRMVNVLASQINQEEYRKEKVRQLRLERNLNKSKRPKH